MNRFVETYNQIEGFHRWPQASGGLSYLAARHRHLFVIRCSFSVEHNERQIEINEQAASIENYLVENFGRPCEFGDASCETICEMLLGVFPAMTKASVYEDGFSGATLTR